MPEIKPLEKALLEIAALLDENAIPYMVIGGMANAKWGRPRTTLDIDITAWIQEHEIKAVISIFEKKSYMFRVSNPLDFTKETRVLPLKTPGNQSIDMIFGAMPYERLAIERAVKVKIGEGFVNFCTAEDLILLKIISDRPQDLEDVKGILKFQKHELDYAYLDPRIMELATLLEKPEIMHNWNHWKKVD